MKAAKKTYRMTSTVEKLTAAHEADASVTPDQQNNLLHEKTEKYKQGLQKVWKTAVAKMQEKHINRFYLKF